MAAQRLHCTHTNMCQVRRQWYEQAKHDTVTWYADAKTSLLICKRYEEMCTETKQVAGPLPTAGTLLVVPTGTHCEHDTVVPRRLQTENNTILEQYQTSTTDNIPHTEMATGTMGPHFEGSPIATPTKTTQNALGSKRVGNSTDMTTTTSTGNHGGSVVSCSPYAHPGIAEICTLH